MARLSGVIAAVLTPFTQNFEPDQDALAIHITDLLAQGCSKASIFGTTGEASSVSCESRIKALDGICERGVDPNALVPGTGSAALSDAVRLTRHAARTGAAAILVAPPYYYPDPPFNGLLAYFKTIARVAADGGVPVILYNYPRMTKIPITLGLITELRAEFGNVIAGIKDSSGDWKQTKDFLDIGDGFDVLPGSETMLPKAVPLGSIGTITGYANIAAPSIRAALDEILTTGKDGPAQQHAWALNQVIGRNSIIECQKMLLARRSGNPSWNRLIPPLRRLSKEKGEAFLEEFNALIGRQKSA